MLKNLAIATRALTRSPVPKIRSITLLNTALAASALGEWWAESGALYIHIDDFIIGHPQPALAIRE